MNQRKFVEWVKSNPVIPAGKTYLETYQNKLNEWVGD